MTEKTLEALTSAIEESYPMFRKYLKRKGEMFGHKNGLPFYDLFAPVGKIDKTFTIEEANAYLVDKHILDGRNFTNSQQQKLAVRGQQGSCFDSRGLQIKTFLVGRVHPFDKPRRSVS